MRYVRKSKNITIPVLGSNRNFDLNEIERHENISGLLPAKGAFSFTKN